MTYDQFLQEVCPGLDLAWRKYRRRAARHRVEERLRQLGLKTFSDYLELVRSDADEAARLPDLMRITVTRFFRDQREWRDLRERILPALVSTHSGESTLRAWSAGCCGGEEPYSLAILWLHYLQPSHPDSRLEILATDIDDASLERAKAALYRTETLREVPAEIRTRWFSKASGQWRLDAAAVSLVRFEKRNLLTDPPLPDIDLVLCRYLPLTYYRGPRLLAVLDKLWRSLREGGILMVGAKEDFPASGSELFEQVPGTRVFYRRRG